jgi:polyhydroxyalkanoate synthase
MSILYGALYPEKIRNLGLMAASVCLRDRDSVLDQWIGDDFFDIQAIADTYGNVPAEFLDAGFSMREPVENNITKYLRFFDGMEDEDFVENFARMERWIDESIDVPGQMFVDFVETVYHEQAIYNNEMYVGGRHADIENLTMPVAQIIGTYDHVVPAEAPRAFTEVLPGEVTVFEQDTGHMGLAVSGSAHAELWPAVCEWYEERSRPEESDTDAEAVSIEIDSGSRESGGATGSPDLQEIRGVGPAYAERLREAGIESVTDLVEADVASLAEETDIPERRLEGWIEQADELAR